MRLNITAPNERHDDSCTCVAVSLVGDVISAGDDFTLRRWSPNGEPLGKVRQFDSCITYITWVPLQGSRKGRGTSASTIEGKDNCLVACANGTFCFLNAASGRVERSVEAHDGSITGLVYSADGSSIVSSGEDGCVKVWSQTGIPRTTLVSAGKCVYALCWGSETTELGGDCVLYCVGGDVIIKPLNPTVRKQLKWKAHKGVVLAVDWSLMNGFIVTCGEDGMYKVWDAYGRSIYVSAPGGHPCTAVKFSADGEMFAVGSFMNVRVCDKTGWSHTYERLPEGGSALSLQWTADGTQVVIGCGSGAVCTAQLVDRKLYWGQYCVTLVEGSKLLVQNVLTDNVEELEQRDKVIKVELGYGHIVACTTTQCACYPIERLSAPVQFDLRDVVITLILGMKHFLLADCNAGMQVYSYEGRLISVVRLQASLRPEIMASDLVSLSPDTVAVRNPADSKKILFFDTNSGKLIENATLTHHLEILSLKLSQSGLVNDRKIAFVDRNYDLYFGNLHQRLDVQKISTMTSSLAWHEHHEILTAIADGRLTTWYYPSIVFSDRDLLAMTKTVCDDGAEDFSRNDRIVSFDGTRVSVRRGADGALLTFNTSPYPFMIFEHVARSDWSGAMRLVRFLDEKPLWAIITGMALRQSELNVAEVGYGALYELDKVRYIRQLKSIPTPEGRQAELALFQRRPTEAERILLQAGLIFRCIDMHTRLFNWERALELATERKTHVDTVLARRQKYLAALGKPETISLFKELEASVKVDWDTVVEKVKQEVIKEAQRPGAKPYQ